MLASLQLLESIFAGVSSASGFFDKATVVAVLAFLILPVFLLVLIAGIFTVACIHVVDDVPDVDANPCCCWRAHCC
jgi:hypothetical protein